ncbi:hypothetical protein FRC17_011339 [Serendipita sp. 399]|nr:hypothetical protein FRC17_011339 [Serendipita sp. 399]
MNIGIACTLVNNEKPLVDLPFHVTPDQVMSDGTINLTPIDKISVWFQEFKKTGMMIDEITGPSLTVDFTGQNPKDVTISFRQDGTWQNGTLHQV